MLGLFPMVSWLFISLFSFSSLAARKDIITETVYVASSSAQSKTNGWLEGGCRIKWYMYRIELVLRNLQPDCITGVAYVFSFFFFSALAQNVALGNDYSTSIWTDRFNMIFISENVFRINVSRNVCQMYGCSVSKYKLILYLFWVHLNLHVVIWP